MSQKLEDAELREAAQRAYLAFAKSLKFQSPLGDPLPTWKDLSEVFKTAWTAVVFEVSKESK